MINMLAPMSDKTDTTSFLPSTYRRSCDIVLLDKRLGDTIPLPDYATEGSAGVDLRFCGQENIVLQPGEVRLLPTGLSIYIEHEDVVGLLRPKSGLGHKKGIILGNCTGVIDSDYQGQTMISCWNRSTEPFEIKVGDEICQMVFQPIIKMSFNIVDEHKPTDRGEGGFGHTGS